MNKRYSKIVSKAPNIIVNSSIIRKYTFVNNSTKNGGKILKSNSFLSNEEASLLYDKLPNSLKEAQILNSLKIIENSRTNFHIMILNIMIIENTKELKERMHNIIL